MAVPSRSIVSCLSNIIHLSLCSGDVYREGELHLIKNNLQKYFSDTGGPKDTDLAIPDAATARQILLEVLYMFNVLHFVPLDDAVQYNIRQYLQQLKDFTETKVGLAWKLSSIAQNQAAARPRPVQSRPRTRRSRPRSRPRPRPSPRPRPWLRQIRTRRRRRWRKAAARPRPRQRPRRPTRSHPSPSRPSRSRQASVLGCLGCNAVKSRCVKT